VGKKRCCSSPSPVEGNKGTLLLASSGDVVVVERLGVAGCVFVGAGADLLGARTGFAQLAAMRGGGGDQSLGLLLLLLDDLVGFLVINCG